MKIINRIKELLDPRPKRDPKVDRVLSITRATRQRRERSHRSLMVALAERDRDEGTSRGAAD